MDMFTSTGKTKWTVETRDIPVELLDEDEDNAREHPDQNIEDILYSLDEYGLQRAVVVQPKADGRYRILAGNGTFRAAVRAGAPVLSCHISDLTGLRAEGYAIADNRTAEGSRWNWQRLAVKLQRQQAAGLSLEPLGWRGEDANRVLGHHPLELPKNVPPPPAPTLGSGGGVPEVTAGPERDPPEGTSDAPLHFDSWRTTTDTLELVARCSGVTEYGLDVASNVHSIVPARVSLLGGDEPLPTLATMRGKAAPGGKVQAKACGLRNRWPPKAICWWNPPYNAMPPWLLQVLWHAGAGGRGAGIVPGNLLDAAWGQALLLARVDLPAAAKRLAEDIGDKPAYACAALDAIRAGEEMQHPDTPVRVFMIRGRVAFLDHRRGVDAVAVKNNNGGSVLVFWGFSELDETVQPDHGVWL